MPDPKQPWLDKYDVIALIGLALFVAGLARVTRSGALIALGLMLMFYAIKTVPPKPRPPAGIA